MKRFKKLLILLVSVMVCASIVLMGTFTAYAEDAYGNIVDYKDNLPSQGTTTVKDNAGKTYSVKRAASVKIGSEVTFPAGVTKIRTPKNRVEAVESNKYAFKEVGFYTLIMSNGYEGLRIECVADGNVMLLDTASVPTYAATGAEIKLPTASMADADNKALSEEENKTYKITVEYVSPEAQSPTVVTDGKFTAGATQGSYFVRYTATKYDKDASAADAKAVYSLIKDFTIQTQKDFEDTEKPTLSVTGVPNNANVRTKVTLPAATAKDNFDENVKVEISVKTPDGSALKLYEEKGHLLVAKEGSVVLDNDKNMSFYPDQTGKYLVTYKATDDNGNVSEATKLIESKDGKAPVIVLEDDNLIPSEWGLSTKNSSSATALTLPAAQAYDNLPFEGTSYQKVAALQIKDPNGNYIYDPTATTPVNTGDCVTEIKPADVVTGYTVDLGKADKGSGTYTVVYRAEDATKLISTKTYKITVSALYSVNNVPTIDVSGAPDFLTAGTQLTSLSDLGVTATSKADGSSTKNAPKVSMSETTIAYKAGGETATYTFAQLQEGIMLMSGGELVVTVNAKDPLGNKASAETVTIPVIDLSDGSSSAVISAPTAAAGSDTEFKLDELDKKAYDFFSAEKDNDALTGSIDGTLQISGTKNVGFEVYVMSGDGSETTEPPAYVESSVSYIEEPVSGVTEGKKIYITSIKVAKDRLSAGTYTAFVRAFDQGYTIGVWSQTVTVTSASSGGDPGINTNTSVQLTAANDGTVNAYSEKILLKRNTVNGAKLGRIIKGSRYSVMGNYMIPMTASETYKVDSYPVEIKSSGFTFLKDSNGKRYPLTETFTTQSDSDITFEVRDSYQSYYKKDQFIKIPNVSVISKYGQIIEFKTSVAAPDKSESSDFYGTLVTDADGKIVPGENYDPEKHTEKYLLARTDGVYVITYKAEATTGTGEYTIKITVGDIVKPQLTVKTAPDTSMKINSKFKFSALEAEDNTTDFSKLKFTRTLLLPDGTKDDISDEDVYAAGTVETTLDVEGTYTVVYTVTDEAGNSTTEKYTITVAKKAATGSASQTVTIVLIVVVVLLIAGLLIYFFVFRKIDFDKRKKKAAAKKAVRLRPENTSKAVANDEKDGEIAVGPDDVIEEESENTDEESDVTGDAEDTEQNAEDAADSDNSDDTKKD